METNFNKEKPKEAIDIDEIIKKLLAARS